MGAAVAWPLPLPLSAAAALPLPLALAASCTVPGVCIQHISGLLISHQGLQLLYRVTSLNELVSSEMHTNGT